MATRSKDRLTQPLIRENSGHRAVSWNEALDRVTDGFQSTIEKQDPRIVRYVQLLEDHQ